MMDTMTVTCPRCGSQTDERFYGPCTSCRTELRLKFEGEGRDVEGEVGLGRRSGD